MVIRDRTVKKDAFYWYKANWTTDPMVHITSRRFTPRDKCPQYVKVYSNCDTVELFVNGLSIGVKTSSDHIFLWEEAIALNVGDNEIRAVGVSGGNDYTDKPHEKKGAPAGKVLLGNKTIHSHGAEHSSSDEKSGGN